MMQLKTNPIYELLACVHAELNETEKAQSYTKLLTQDYTSRKEGYHVVRHLRNQVLLLQRSGQFEKAQDVIQEANAKLPADFFNDNEYQHFSQLLTVYLTLLGAFNSACLERDSSSLYTKLENLSEKLDSNFLKGYSSFYLSQYFYLWNKELEKASHFASLSQSILEKADLKKERFEDAFPPHQRDFLLARVYATQMEIKLSESKFDLAEEFGKKCLDIANKILERDDAFFQWSLHLLAIAMVNQQKNFYGEGLCRRLEQLILPESPSNATKPFYVFQLESLKSYATVLEHMDRKNEADLVRKKMERMEVDKLLPSLHFHCLFDRLNYSLSSNNS